MRHHLPGLMLLGVVITVGPLVAGPRDLAAAAADSNESAERGAETIRATPDDDAQTPPRFSGKVLAIDPRAGRVLVVTDAGMVIVRTTADELAKLSVGDEIDVTTPESAPDPRPAPR
jgi:hypothetical protein